ncbi:MAG: hypothetical protein H0V62_01605 [Gammaproteobacteria bacterium]|nr:hypothetical protein [Gammaproteobacteria bacterium]
MEYRLHIEGDFKPETFPLQRLAKYLTALSNLLGHEHLAALVRIEGGSVTPVAQIGESDEPKVKRRLMLVKDNSSAHRAYRAIDDLLANDNASGDLIEGALTTGKKILRFPGKERYQDETVAPFWQPGTLQGRVVRVEGKDKTVHVGLLDGDQEYACSLEESLALDLARHFHETLRVQGKGRWLRGEDGGWELLSFKIESYVVLSSMDLQTELENLRGKSLGWPEVDKPWEELESLRNGDVSE